MKKLLVLVTLYTSIAQAGFISSTAQVLTAPFIRHTITTPVRIVSEVVVAHPVAASVGALACISCMFNFKEMYPHSISIIIQDKTNGETLLEHKYPVPYSPSSHYLPAALSIAASAILVPLVYSTWKELMSDVCKRSLKIK